MALRGRFKNLKNDAGTLVAGTAITTTDYSETLSLGGLASFGIMVDTGTVAHQTDGYLYVNPEFSYDSGTTWVANAAAGLDEAYVSTDTAKVMGVIGINATGDDRVGYWRNPFPSDSDIKLRFALTVAGTGTHTFTLTAVKFFGRTEV